MDGAGGLVITLTLVRTSDALRMWNVVGSCLILWARRSQSRREARVAHAARAVDDRKEYKGKG